MLLRIIFKRDFNKPSSTGQACFHMALDTLFGFLLYTFLNISIGRTARACKSPLGMKDFRIRDDQITASTYLYFDKSYTRYYRPKFARLNFEEGGGGWCSEEHARYPSQYLDIDLGVEKKVTSIGTQGRFGGNEWVDEYGILYKRDNDTDFREYSENGAWKMFIGNNDTKSEVKRVFRHPIIARRIRIVPQGNYFTIYCMRLELYGCKWKKEKDGLEQYFASGIGKIYNGINMLDKGYDGAVDARIGFSANGLGQLTDDIYGTSNIKENIPSRWVGFQTRHPVLIFKFRAKRQFNMIKFHTINKGDKLRVFAKVEIEISNDNKNFTRHSVYTTSSAERLSASAFKISVPLRHVVCQYIKVKFSQLGSWIAISEVDFLSDIPNPKLIKIKNAITTQKPVKVFRVEKTFPTPKQTFVTFWPKVLSIPDFPNDVPTSTPGQSDENNVDFSSYDYTTEDDSSSRGLSFPIIVAIVLGALVLTVIMVVLIVRKIRQVKKSQQRHKQQSQPTKARTSQLLGEYPRCPPNMPPQQNQQLVQPVVIQMNGVVQYKTKLLPLDSGYTSTGSAGSMNACRACDIRPLHL